MKVSIILVLFNSSFVLVVCLNIMLLGISIFIDSIRSLNQKSGGIKAN